METPADVERPPFFAASSWSRRSRASLFDDGTIAENKVSLVFENIHFTVQRRRQAPKAILHGVSGAVVSGNVLAIMGPSGAGKTTLLDVLTLQARGKVQGTVQMNGKPLTKAAFQRDCAYVTQDDRLCAVLTVKETLTYAAALYSGRPRAERRKLVDKLLQETGLQRTAATKVGNQFFKGISGGQKRRLSVAIEMVKRPLCLFLDEPTSGLDSASAQAIMQLLCDLAVDAQMLIVATIHQPPSRVFSSFDQLMVLTGGRAAYVGDAQLSTRWMEEVLCQPKPSEVSPAEFMLDAVNSEFTELAKVQKVVAAWELQQEQAMAKLAVLRERTVAGVGRPGCAVSFGRQILVLTSRQALVCLRDPMVYLGRVAVFLATSCLLSTVYLDARDRTQERVQDRMFLLMWHIGVPSLMGVIGAPVLDMELLCMKKEAKNGLYNLSANLTARLILQVPAMALLSVAALGVGCYGMIGFYSPHFLAMVCVHAALLLFEEVLVELLVVLGPNYLLAMLNFVGLWFFQFLFAGVFIARGNCVAFLRWLYDINPIAYCVRAMMWLEFHEAEFSGYKETAVPGPNGTSTSTSSCAAVPQQCFGRDGAA